MTTFNLTGFSIQYDPNDDETPTAVGAASLSVTFPDDQAVLNYSIIDATDPTDIPTVELGGTDDLGATISDMPISDNVEEFLGSGDTSEGTHTVVVFFDPANNTDFIFQIGGDPLTLPTSVAELPEFTNLRQATEAFAPDQGIPFTDLLAMPTITSTEDDLIIVDNDEFSSVAGGFGDDTIDMSGLSTSDGYVEFDYSGLAAPIDVSIDGGANTGSVVKSGIGTDTLIDVENPLQAGWTFGGLSILGTTGDDTFNLAPEGQQWVSIRPGDGVDTIIANTNATERLDSGDPVGLVRIDMSDGNGIDVNLATRTIADDGFGNPETIGGTAPVWEVVGSGGNDVFVGSDNVESYRYSGGNNDLDGGLGFDRLRYDSSGVASVVIDAANGVVNGTFDGGGTFTDTISGFERLRGSTGDDTIIGEATVGNRFEGRGGADSFVHLGGDDTIGDFNAGEDTLVVRVAGLDQAAVDAAMTNATDAPGDVSGSFSEGAQVDFGGTTVTFAGLTVADLAGATVQFVEPGGANLVPGTDGDDFLEGTPVDDLIITGDATPNGDFVVGSAGNDTIDMSGMNPSTAFMTMGYGDLGSAISVDLDGAANTATVDKGALGTDTLIDIANPLDAGFNLGGFGVIGTAQGDTFDLDPGAGQWMQVRGGDGAESYVIGDTGFVRLDFVFVEAPQGAEIDLGLATDQIINDGFGNTETITGPGTVWEIRGTENDDLITGSAADESFISREGDDTIDGGGGFDRLRYDRSGVDGITADLAAGQVTGTWNGVAFTDTISNIEHLRGSNGNDVIGGNTTDNLLEGRGGTDAFVHLGGNDTISDFDAATETLIVRVAGLDQAQVDAGISGATDQNGSALVTFGAGSVLFSGVSAAQLQGIDAQFQAPDEANVVQGTDGDDFLEGTAGDDLIITGDATPNGDFVVGSAGNDTIDMSGMNPSTAFMTMGYGDLGSAISVDIDGAANTATVDKGALGTDTLIDIANPLDAGFNLGGFGVIGTAQGDTFDLDPGAGQWMQVRGGDGADSYVIGDTGFVRLDFVFVEAPQGAEIDLGLATDQIINDGFGNTETITGPGTVWEIRGTENDDLITGSAADESFISREGDDTIDGGGGFDRLRYDRSGVDFVVGDLATGTVTGSWFGSTFTDTISNIEFLRGSGNDDILVGDTEDNRLEGGGGEDFLDGNGGDNTLNGGDGVDSFVIGSGATVIEDFELGTDLILVDLDALGGVGEQDFVDALRNAQAETDGARATFTATDSVTFEGLTKQDVASIADTLDLGVPSPPPPPPTPAAWTLGDPHLLTLDGLGYDFQAVGEYVLLRGQTGEDVGGFEIQSRMTPATDDQGADLDNVSVNAAIAMRAANGDAVMIDSDDALPLSVNGTAVSLADGDVHDVGVDRVFRSGDTYTMVFAGADDILNDGDTQVAVVVHDARVDLSVRVSEALAGRVEGLLGDGDGNIGNDIARADGTVLERPLAFEDLYGGYRDDWRVDTEGDSLFTYDAGESLGGFYDANKPGAVTTLDDFDAGALSAAQQAVAASGLTPGTLNYDNAVLDFLLTDDQSFIDSAASEDVAAPDTASAAPTLDVGQGRATLNITVNDRAGDGIEGASVGFSAGASTAPSLAEDAGGGAYALSVGDGASGRVDGTLDATNTGEITAGDALEVLRIAVGLDPSWGPAQGLDFVAADLNDDARVTAGDALEVLRAAVGLDSEHAPRWKFVDPDQDVSGASANDVPELGGVDIAAINVTQNVEMTAVLLGNMENFA